MPRAKKVEAEEYFPISEAGVKAAEAQTLQSIADTPVSPLITLRYSAEDMQKLDQFAIGLLRDGTGSIRADDVAFVNRVRDAYLRAEVMLTVRKEIAALEAWPL